MENNKDSFLKVAEELSKLLPNLTIKDMTTIHERLEEIINEDNFFRFMNGSGDYPSFSFMPDEQTIKDKIYSSFKREYTEYIGKARYKIIDLVLNKYYQDENKKVHDQFYLFLMLINHLLLKIIFRIGNPKDIPDLYKIFTSNLDYMFINADCSRNMALRSVLVPVKYFNEETNTIGYGQTVNIDKARLLIDFSKEVVEDKDNLVLDIFNILENKDMSNESKDKFKELTYMYLLIIIHLSNNTVTICHDCKELYIDFKVVDKNLCYDCYNHRHNLGRVFVY